MGPGKKKCKYNCDMIIEYLKFNRAEKHYKNCFFFFFFFLNRKVEKKERGRQVIHMRYELFQHDRTVVLFCSLRCPVSMNKIL